MATFHEEDTKPWTKITNTRVRTPVMEPPVGPNLNTGFRLRPATYIHIEWGTTWFKYLGQPSYWVYWFHMSAYDQLVQRLIKVKHTIVPYSFFRSEDRVRTPLLLCTQRPPYLSPTKVLFHQVNLRVIFAPLVAFSVGFFYTPWFDLSSGEGGKDVLKIRKLNMHQMGFKQLLDLSTQMQYINNNIS